jgi:hypothetical protein
MGIGRRHMCEFWCRSGWYGVTGAFDGLGVRELVLLPVLHLLA